MVQGLAFGAEWGGAILMTFEHAPWRKKGLYTGITQAGFPVGLLLANLAFLASVPLGATGRGGFRSCCPPSSSSSGSSSG